MLEWVGPDEGGALLAYAGFAIYVIWRNDSGRYHVGFFPAPGPECPWDDSLATIDEAFASAARCAEHVHELRKHHWGREPD